MNIETKEIIISYLLRHESQLDPELHEVFELLLNRKPRIIPADATNQQATTNGIDIKNGL